MHRAARRVGLGAIATAGVLTGSTGARAQAVDENPPLPNVLLLIDNSGSMERMIDGSLPESNLAADAPSICIPGTQSNPNRWGIALQTLTGDLQPYYSCISEPRSSKAATLPAGSLPSGTLTDFNDEFKINGKLPYDSGYVLNYHRPVTGPTSGWTGSNSCVFGPGSLPGATPGTGVGPGGAGYPATATPGQYATDFPTTGIVQRLLTTPSPVTGNSPTAAGPNLANPTTYGCTFTQLADGALDNTLDYVRFGFMTFDQDPGPGIGVTGAAASETVSFLSGPTPNTYNPPFDGMWSYFPGWNTASGACATGNLANCATVNYEVGARNPAAPPWEGRMLPFPASSATISQVESANANVQEVLSATRPYGATPVDGLFYDAQYYFLTDPAGPKQSDPLVGNGGCRAQYIILLTDGAPNQDMRTGCTAGTCPYPLTPDVIAANLYNGNKATGSQVTTYVIGFAVSSFLDQGVQAHCSDAVITTPTPHLDTSKCTDPLFSACCTLENIAIQGGSQHAYFADTAGDLSSALAAILGQIASQTTSRTTPAYSPIISNPSTNPSAPVPQAETFLSSFSPGNCPTGATCSGNGGIAKPWSGDIQRQTQSCNYDSTNKRFLPPNAPAVNPAQGDDFGADLDSHQGSMKRTYYAVLPANLDGTSVIRPWVSSTPSDGLAANNGTTYSDAFVPSSLTGTLSNIMGNIPPSVLGITADASGNATNPQCANTLGTKHLTTSQCESLAFDFTFGFRDTPGLLTQAAPPYNVDSNSYLPFFSRYCNTGCGAGTPDRTAFGGIFHATPSISAGPSALLDDESYALYTATYSTRKTIVYGSTTDGLLHGFWADTPQGSGAINNEVFAFVPPAVMPQLLTQYPTANQLLLDGAPVTKDVIFQRTNNLGSSIGIQCGVANGIAQSCDWHTMLVGSYGTQGRGYYALDVTNPDPTFTPNGGSAGKPIFQWQLTKMPAVSNPTAGTIVDVFGQHSGTSAITTVAVNATITGGGSSGSGLMELGVAVLPGGEDVSGPTSTSTGCTRAKAPPSSGTFLPRGTVRCWGANALPADPVIGRSLAIVNLQTGELVRVFARKADFDPNSPLIKKGVIIDTPLDSPMTGTPVVYPSDVGAVAQKVFIGDADGTVWKFDLTNPDSTKWTGTLFLDTFNSTADAGSGGSGSVNTAAWKDSQPIQIPPVVALDRVGAVVLGIATGDQESYTASGTNFIYSVSDKLIAGSSPPTLGPSVNWYTKLINGERVSGPAAIFDTTFYLATFAPASPAGCSLGTPKIWGMDYETPASFTDPSQGGAPQLNVNTQQWIDPSIGTPSVAGKIIPGVTINLTPACADISTSVGDNYVAGQTHTIAQSVTSGTYSLFAQFSGKSSTGTSTVGTYSQALPPPQTATFIDSWAAVVE